VVGDIAWKTAALRIVGDARMVQLKGTKLPSPG